MLDSGIVVTHLDGTIVGGLSPHRTFLATESETLTSCRVLVYKRRGVSISLITPTP